MKQLLFLLAMCAYFGGQAKTNHYVFAAMLGDSPIEMQLSDTDENAFATYLDIDTHKSIELRGKVHEGLYELAEYDEHNAMVAIWTLELYDRGCIWGSRADKIAETETVIAGFLSEFAKVGISGLYQGSENYHAILIERDTTAFQVFLHVGGEDVGDIQAIGFWRDKTHSTAFVELPQDMTPDLPCLLELYIHKNSIEIKESSPCHEFRGVGTTFEGKIWKKEVVSYKL